MLIEVDVTSNSCILPHQIPFSFLLLTLLCKLKLARSAHCHIDKFRDKRLLMWVSSALPYNSWGNTFSHIIISVRVISYITISQVPLFIIYIANLYVISSCNCQGKQKDKIALNYPSYVVTQIFVGILDFWRYHLKLHVVVTSFVLNCFFVCHVKTFFCVLFIGDR